MFRHLTGQESLFILAAGRRKRRWSVDSPSSQALWHSAQRSAGKKPSRFRAWAAGPAGHQQGCIGLRRSPDVHMYRPSMYCAAMPWRYKVPSQVSKGTHRRGLALCSATAAWQRNVRRGITTQERKAEGILVTRAAHRTLHIQHHGSLWRISWSRAAAVCCQIFPTSSIWPSRLFRRRAQPAGFANFPMLFFSASPPRIGSRRPSGRMGGGGMREQDVIWPSHCICLVLYCTVLYLRIRRLACRWANMRADFSRDTHASCYPRERLRTGSSHKATCLARGSCAGK